MTGSKIDKEEKKPINLTQLGEQKVANCNGNRPNVMERKIAEAE